MFYGMPAARPRKDLRDEERTKYAPWNNARMGGGLQIEWHGKHYRIERTFGAREKDDTLIVTDMETGKVTDALGDVPGEKVFGISREAFASTLLLTSESTAPTADGLDVQAPLQAELGSVDPDPDMKKLPGALKRLQDAVRYYNRQGGRGHLAQLRDERTQLAADMRTIRTQYHELKQKETQDLAREQSGEGFVEKEGSDFNYLEADADSTADIKDYTRILSDTQDLDDVHLTDEDLHDSKLMRRLTEQPEKKSHGKLIATRRSAADRRNRREHLCTGRPAAICHRGGCRHDDSGRYDPFGGHVAHGEAGGQHQPGTDDAFPPGGDGPGTADVRRAEGQAEGAVRGKEEAR
jgi:hypothetical protein